MSKSKGHIAAIFTIIIWGTTFIFTKVLLQVFSPIEIQFLRYTIGFIVLLICYPKRLKVSDAKKEMLFAAAGLSGITLYQLLENTALTMTTASNVGIIITIAPFFTSILSMIFLKTKRPGVQFYLGFVVAIIGVALISYNGSSSLEINPVGDLLAVFCAIAWAFYSILLKKIEAFGYNTIQTTRRIFMYGILFIVPIMFVLGFDFNLNKFMSPVNVGSILFLGVFTSAICFVTWSKAVKLLGEIKSSAYIYLIPVVTVATSVIVLKEALTPILIVGAGLTLMGLLLSQGGRSEKKDF
ncbi:MAG: DMT family transporter [Suipraeoptans sp.]